MQAFLANKVKLDFYCDRLNANGFVVFCAECGADLLKSSPDKKLQFVAREDLDLNSTGEDSSEFFYNSCARQHSHAEDESQHALPKESPGLPTHSKAVLTETQLWLRANSHWAESLVLDPAHSVVSCKHCLCELGRIPKGKCTLLVAR